MDAREIRQKTNEFIDLKSEIVSYILSIKDMAQRMKNKLIARNLLGNDSDIKDLRIIASAEICIIFNQNFQGLIHQSIFQINNYSKDTPLEVKELLKPIIVEIFTYKKIWEKITELEKKLNDIYLEYKSIIYSKSKVAPAWRKFVALEDFAFKDQKEILKELKDYLKTLSDEEISLDGK